MPHAWVNGARLYYEEVGEGEPVLLVMGFGATWEAWEPQIPTLSRRYRVIAYDNRGVGRSDKPLGPYTVKSLAEDGRGLLDHLGIGAAHVVGLSMGGMIAMDLAARHPSRVLSLVLAATAASADARLRWVIGKTTARVTAKLLGTFGDFQTRLEAAQEEMLRLWLPICYSAAPGGPEEALLRRQIEQACIEGFSPGGILSQLAACFSHDARPLLGRVQAPTLVLGGTEDRLFAPARLEQLARTVPGARLRLIDGAPHGLNYAAAEAFNEEVLRFCAAPTRSARFLSLSAAMDAPRPAAGRPPAPGKRQRGALAHRALRAEGGGAASKLVRFHPLR